jgi:outer membrane immunogenic protein
MKQLALGAAALALATGTAVAADLMPLEPIPAIAPVAAGYDWSGVYLGAQLGGAWGDAEIDDGLGYDPEFDIDGWYGGGILGAQWQWNWLVLGAEGEINWADIEGDQQNVNGLAGNDAQAEIDWFGSLNAKAGVGINRVLVYATGGLAFADASTGQSIVGVDSFDESENYWGWTAGAGAEVAVTNNIIVGLQYRYYDFGDENFDPPGLFTDRDQDLSMHTVSARVSYKFNLGP